VVLKPVCVPVQPLDRIFQMDTSTPNYLTIMLSRSDDPDQPYPGNITIGETLAGYDAITSMPKIDTASTPSGNSANQHWQVLLDSNGIIGPDGNFINYTTQVPTTSDTSQATVIFDSSESEPYGSIIGLTSRKVSRCLRFLHLSLKPFMAALTVHVLPASIVSGKYGCCPALQRLT